MFLVLRKWRNEEKKLKLTFSFRGFKMYINQCLLKDMHHNVQASLLTFIQQLIHIFYSRQQNYSNICYNTCDFPLVWHSISITSFYKQYKAWRSWLEKLRKNNLKNTSYRNLRLLKVWLRCIYIYLHQAKKNN